MMNPANKEYIAVLSDVAIKFNAYKTYKTREGALKILAKKTANFPDEDNEGNFDTATLIYHKAAELISSHNYEDRSKNTTGFSAFEDILYDACLAEIKRVAPQADETLIAGILNWAIQWYYLR